MKNLKENKACKTTIDDEKLQSKEFHSLWKAAHSILLHKDFDVSARIIFDEACTITGATSGYVALLNEDGDENEVVFLESGGKSCAVDPELPMPIRGLRAKSYQTGKAIYENAFMDSEWVKFMPAGHVILKNVMFSPLNIDGKTVGIMGLANKEGNFNDKDATMATAFGEIAAIALKNSWMYENENKLKAQFLHAQKLEAVGQLSAGIAHEINTPAQYLKINIDFLYEATDDLIEFIENIKKLETLNIKDAQGKIYNALEEIDWEYLREEIPNAIEQSKEGVKRISSIVSAIKEFSHPANKQKKLFDLNRIVETTVTISKNEWKDVAVMELDLDPDLPEIPLLSEDMGHVILNLIVNASYAINENQQNDKGIIKISTRNNGDMVEMRIKDTGTGIPEDSRSRIFDPFYTTKEEGKGTGQGLTICYDIITNKHNGTIEFNTETGKGTEFVINIPLRSLQTEKGFSAGH